MSGKQIFDEIFATLRELPLEKLVEVRDFAIFLKGRGPEKTGVPESYAWTEEELHELSAAVWDYGNQTVPWEDSTVRSPKL